MNSKRIATAMKRLGRWTVVRRRMKTLCAALISAVANYSLFTIICSLFMSCEYKDLCYDHNHWALATPAFDWSKAPSANPKSMTVLVYDKANLGSEPERYDYRLVPPYPEIRLTPGDYQALTYNNDTETILLRGLEEPSTVEAYTRTSSIEEGTMIDTRAQMPRAAGNEPVILEPDSLWAGLSEDIHISLDSLYKIKMMPEPRFVEIDITVKNVPNLKYVGQMGGALTGLAASIFLETGKLSENTATQAFTCEAVDGSTIHMKFRCFGHCPYHAEGSHSAHIFTLYAVLADGSKWYYTQDVSEQMHDPETNPDEYNLYLELEELPIPKPIVNGSGFQPTIDGWQGVEIDVGM